MGTCPSIFPFLFFPIIFVFYSGGCGRICCLVRQRPFVCLCSKERQWSSSIIWFDAFTGNIMLAWILLIFGFQWFFTAMFISQQSAQITWELIYLSLCHTGYLYLLFSQKDVIQLAFSIKYIFLIDLDVIAWLNMECGSTIPIYSLCHISIAPLLSRPCIKSLL